ncbi:MAG: hypothetical protein A3F41_06065 [Coxiella sp. RIFCSPHIGHO2_12_FULL_44_14]|nr:MAG: hypothetical protein A3F41_06065 [Coxiella sp. RIFCSPHIGHO2_12_FULL_44_14]
MWPNFFMHLISIEPIPESVEKKKIAHRFNRAASVYEGASDLQKQVGAQLLTFTQAQQFHPSLILDVAGGSGYFTRWFTAHYPAACVVMMDLAEALLRVAAQHPSALSRTLVHADFDQLPFGSGIFDWIYANMSLQWSLHLHHTLMEMHRVLAKQGWLVFSLPVEGSLQELVKALQKTNGTVVATHRFISVRELADIVHRLAWTHINIYTEEKTFYYPGVDDLLYSLKRTGANYVPYARPRCWTKKMLSMLDDHYRSEYDAHRIKATYRIAYVLGKK